jgi:hypothetical protein
LKKTSMARRRPARVPPIQTVGDPVQEVLNPDETAEGLVQKRTALLWERGAEFGEQ